MRRSLQTLPSHEIGQHVRVDRLTMSPSNKPSVQNMRNSLNYWASNQDNAQKQSRPNYESPEANSVFKRSLWDLDPDPDRDLRHQDNSFTQASVHSMSENWSEANSNHNSPFVSPVQRKRSLQYWDQEPSLAHAENSLGGLFYDSFIRRNNMSDER
jgi:hypothetical protein